MIKSIIQNTLSEISMIGHKEDFSNNNFYDFEAKLSNGETVPMSFYKDKVVVIVNTASKCGFTRQYEGLENLHQKYNKKGLVILGFPCNQFGEQEPGTDEEILSFCQVNYGVSFPIFEKTDVNGKNAHPLFQYLKSQLHDFPLDSIKWNFTKFVIDRKGNPIKRYSPQTEPEDMENDIVDALNSKS